MRTLLYNCGEVAHLSNQNNEFPISGDYLHERENLVHQPGMSIMIEDSTISKIGPMEDLLTEFAPWYPAKSENSDTKISRITILQSDCYPDFRSRYPEESLLQPDQ